MLQARLPMQTRFLALFAAISFGLASSSSSLAATNKNTAVEYTSVAANPVFSNGTVSPVGITRQENWHTGAPGSTGPANGAEQEPLKDKENQLSPGAVLPAPVVSWTDPAVPPKAVILCVHGLGLHKGTFETLGKRLSKDGIVTYALDIRGFGEWMQGENRAVVDFPRSLDDIKQALEQIHKTYPDLPVIILGESMGGAIALHATALYPNLIAGLVSSVPAGDRFGQTEEELKIGFRALLSGFNKEMKVGPSVVEQATKKEDLRSAWEGDPLARMELSPKELMEFQSFMNKNFANAQAISSTPVLFIQGMNDKLVRPAGTWKLYDSLTTPSRELVFSKSAEHLIFEEGQFGEDDIHFVESWLAKNVLKSPDAFAASPGPSSGNAAAATTISPPGNTPSATTMPLPGNAGVPPTQGAPQGTLPRPSAPTTSNPVLSTANGAILNFQQSDSSTSNTSSPKSDTKTAIAYWIELLRDGKIYRCNNKCVFHSGDSIRFHLLPEADGYAYLVMKQGTTGKRAVLFPDPETGLANDVTAGQDYTMPTKAWLSFDQNPGVEKVTLIFSKKPLDDFGSQTSKILTAYVSSDQSGSKDLIPTRMQLSWDDPDPVIIPSSFSSSSKASLPTHSQLTSFDPKTSLIRVSQESSADTLAVDIALTHL
jgi:acylglycerol lipase